MAIGNYFSGSATIGATALYLNTGSTSPSTETQPGVYQLFLDLTNLAAGDSFRLRAYEQVASGGTNAIFLDTTFSGAQNPVVYVSPSYVLLQAWYITVAKTAGTDRIIRWAIRQVY